MPVARACINFHHIRQQRSFWKLAGSGAEMGVGRAAVQENNAPGGLASLKFVNSPLRPRAAQSGCVRCLGRRRFGEKAMTSRVCAPADASRQAPWPSLIIAPASTPVCSDGESRRRILEPIFLTLSPTRVVPRRTSPLEAPSCWPQMQPATGRKSFNFRAQTGEPLGRPVEIKQTVLRDQWVCLLF